MTQLNKGKLKYDDLKDTENHEIGLRLHSFNSWLLSFSLAWRGTEINVDIELLSDLINYLSNGMESLKDDR